MSHRSARLELTGSPRACGEARTAVRSLLGAWHVPAPAVDDVLLVVTELVANAVRHARTASTLELDLARSGDLLRLAVTDGSPEEPASRAAALTDEGGRGLAILSALADRWGSEPWHEGKRVWLEIDLAAAYAASATA